MLLDLTSFLLAASLASGASIPLQDPYALYARQDSGDPGLQDIPSTGKADNTFSNGLPDAANFPKSDATPPAIYGNRTIDLPFGRLYHGNLKLFPAGQLNTPGNDTDLWQPQGQDSASQSACGIPDNAFSISKVAIHPYFLKYADLSRYCMQDVCISFWNEDGSSDMMLKVTDICSTDPSDPTYCATPADIKVDRTKVQIMQKLNHHIEGDVYPEKTWWFFMKCWYDGLVQPAYADNWFAQPPLPNNLDWAQATQHQQWANNQEAYPKHDPPLPTYPNGAYNPKRDSTTSPPIEDFDPNETYNWTPIAGGKGWGNPGGKASGTSGNGGQAAPASSGTSGTSGSTGSTGSGSSGSGSSGSSGTSSTPATNSGAPASGQSSGSQSSNSESGTNIVNPNSPAVSGQPGDTNSAGSTGQGSGTNLVLPNSPAVSGQPGAAGTGQGSGTHLVNPNSGAVAQKSQHQSGSSEQQDTCDDTADE